MAITTAGKALLWAVGGFFALACVGVIILFGAAGVAMWKNSDEMEREAARRHAAYLAMTPEQHLAEARSALEASGGARLCLIYLKPVPMGMPGRAEVLDAAVKQVMAEAKAALAGPRGGSACLNCLADVPEDTPGRAELFAAATREKAEEDREAAAMEALTPAQHIAEGRKALEAGNLQLCQDHLLYPPSTTPGFAALRDALVLARQQKALKHP
jgi:hypothetical protein